MRSWYDRVSSFRAAEQRREHFLQTSGQDIRLFHAFEQHGVLFAKKFVFVLEALKIAALKIRRVLPRHKARGVREGSSYDMLLAYEETRTHLLTGRRASCGRLSGVLSSTPWLPHVGQDFRGCGKACRRGTHWIHRGVAAQR